MANIIAQEQQASDDEGDSFHEEPPHWRAHLQSMWSISSASSLVDDNFFRSLSVDGDEDGSVQGDEEYVGTGFDSSSESGSDGDVMEIMNKEVCTTFFLIQAVITDYNTP